MNTPKDTKTLTDRLLTNGANVAQIGALIGTVTWAYIKQTLNSMDATTWAATFVVVCTLASLFFHNREFRKMKERLEEHERRINNHKTAFLLNAQVNWMRAQAIYKWRGGEFTSPEKGLMDEWNTTRTWLLENQVVPGGAREVEKFLEHFFQYKKEDLDPQPF